MNRYLLIGLLNLTFLFCHGQEKKYDLFTIKGKDLVWQNTYHYPASPDSLRYLVVKMLKSKFFTFNVIRNETGYNGEIRHFKIDCKKYQRTYLNTPRLYWDGEWTGKFIVEMEKDHYRVSVYALYVDTTEKSSDYFRTEKEVHKRYLEVVTRNGVSFRKRELSDMSLLSISLKDEFDIRKMTPVEE